MNLRRQALAAALALVASGAAPPPVGRASAIDVQHSHLTVYVRKQGLFAFLADDHTIDAPIRSGTYERDPKGIRFTVEAGMLRVLDPALPPDRRAEVQENMLGPKVLDAAKYPEISFRSTQIDERTINDWTVMGDLTLHGQTHPIRCSVVRLDATHFTGSATVRQTAFGIRPIRVAGGVVSVKDDVEVRFAIVLSPPG